MEELMNLSKAFLLFGSDNPLKDEVKHLISLAEELEQKSMNTKEALLMSKNKIDNIQAQFDIPGLIEKLNKYITIENQIRFLECGQVLHQLDNLTHNNKQTNSIPSQITNLVLTLKYKAPSIIPNNSILRQKVNEVANKIKSTQLDLFHSKFEDHLHIETSHATHTTQTTSTASTHDELGRSRSDISSSNNNNSWILFLEQSREWLLAYTCISLLPILNSESCKVMIKDTYIEALDQALTPLWGRFYFQLSYTRETFAELTNTTTSTTNTETNTTTNTTNSNTNTNNSIESLLWTFSYTRTFLDMVLGLVSELAESSVLQGIYEYNYDTIAMEYVIDKIIKFIRAHYADIIVLYTPLLLQTSQSTSYDIHIVILVEYAFDLDDYIHQYLLLHSKSGHNSDLSLTYRLTISQVLCESKAFYIKWLHIEHNNYLQYILNLVVKYDNMISFDFGVSAAYRFDLYQNSGGGTQVEAHSTGTYGSGTGNYIRRGKDSCYRCIYELTKLFILSTQRYQYLSLAGQNTLSALILEPLLSYIVGLLLYFTKADPLLYAISHKTSFYFTEIVTEEMIYNYKQGQNVYPKCDHVYPKGQIAYPKGDSVYPKVLEEYLSSLYYFEKCLCSPFICTDIYVRDTNRYVLFCVCVYIYVY